MTATAMEKIKRETEKQKKVSGMVTDRKEKRLKRVAATGKTRKNDKFKKKLMTGINFRKKYTIYYIEKAV